MKLCRFNEHRLGLVDAQAATVADITSALDVLPAQRYPLPGHDLMIEHFAAVREAAQGLLAKAPRFALGDVRLLAPVANPGKIIGAPVNYQDHRAEAASDPGLAHGRDMAAAAVHTWGMFLKARTSLVGPSEGVTLRTPFTDMENRNDHEIELVAVIGRRGTRIRREEAMDYVMGYSVGLDMTLRGPQFAGFRKSIDSYGVLGPWLVTADEFGDPSDVSLRLCVNGEERQNANTRDLVYDIPRLIEFASSFYTLEPGDLLYTGTPAGVGPVRPGDVIEASIERIGLLKVAVR